MDFIGFPKMARLSREIVITEKIDGTNAQIYIPTLDGCSPSGFHVGSRTRWITPENDNYGFAVWAYKNREELLQLGPGHHFGEWWGSGIQRKYDLNERRFSLFNVSRWSDVDSRPSCCGVVPTLYRGVFNSSAIDTTINLLVEGGSQAAPGFMKPEGIIIFHTAAMIGFKKTIENDSIPKSLCL